MASSTTSVQRGELLTVDKIETLHHLRDTTIAEDSYAGALPACGRSTGRGAG
ncbi:hypothetical protein [Streptomyces sp. NPDC016172]|uniref:hypothetical protein n=1 Tax=Streptomyces sp. NPDC016172 TaxID=3364964 RepID=UPI003702BA09